MSRYYDKCHWPCEGVAGLEGGEAPLAKKTGWWESAGKAFLQGHVGNYQEEKEVLKAWGQHAQKNESLGEKNPWFWNKWWVGWCLPSPKGLVCWELPTWQVQTTCVPLLDIGYIDLAAFGEVTKALLLFTRGTICIQVNQQHLFSERLRDVLLETTLSTHQWGLES